MTGYGPDERLTLDFPLTPTVLEITLLWWLTQPRRTMRNAP